MGVKQKKKKAEPNIKNGCQTEKNNRTKKQQKKKKTEPVAYFRRCRPFVVCVVRRARVCGAGCSRAGCCVPGACCCCCRRAGDWSSPSPSSNVPPSHWSSRGAAGVHLFLFVLSLFVSFCMRTSS